MTGTWSESWILGAGGLYTCSDGCAWEPRGGDGYPIHDLVRLPGRLLCAAHWGLWEVTEDGSGEAIWTQLHDETLTECLSIAPSDGAPVDTGPGVVAGSAYGLAFGKRIQLGACRWRSRDHGLSLNERFTNTVICHPDRPQTWLTGTESGVLIYSAIDDAWLRSDLTGRPCRALLHALGRFWAGTDEGGIWSSADGLAWQRAGSGLDDGTIFSLAATTDRILAGTLQGICVGDAEASWHRCGPRLLVSAIAADPDRQGPWLAGATPGGLWRSDDDGSHWCQVGNFDTVQSILPPEAA